LPLIQANGLSFQVEDSGQGEPLLLLMGLGADGTAWEPHAAAYRRHFRCIIPDNRGAGRSSKPPGPYFTKEMARDALELMDALGIEKFHVSGISMGGAIAQELALLAPHRLQTATMVGTWDKCDAHTANIFRMFRDLVATSDTAAFQRMLQLWIFTAEHHRSNPDDLLHRERAAASHPYPTPVHAFQAQCDACLTHEASGRLHRITSPVLVTVGDQDPFTPLAYSEAIVRQLPDAQLLVFAGGGHAHHWEQLESFNAQTLQFMLDHPIRA
jgi:pimeloyl-ACP methyl ester carboxylesterase